MSVIKNSIAKLNLKGLGGKMVIMTITPILFMLLIAGFILFNVRSITRELSSVLTNTVPSLTTSKDLVIEMKTMEMNLWKIHFLKSNPAEVQAAVFDYEDSTMRFSSNLERYMKVDMPEKATKIRLRVNETWSKLNPLLLSFKENLHKNKFDEGFKDYEANIRPSLSEIGDLLSDIELNNANVVEVEKDASEVITSTVTKRSLWACVLASSFALCMTYLMIRKISVNLMMITNDLNSETKVTKEKANDMATNSSNLAMSTSKMEKAIGETSSAIEQIKAMIEKSNTSAHSTVQITHENVRILEKGKVSISNLKDTFKEIQLANEDVIKVMDDNTHKITEILNVIQSIDAKTRVINDIVFQTKLLSFNASVEAARAGDSGKGFAVVAEEVGKLAISSGKASQEIGQLIRESQDQVKKIVAETQQDMGRVVEGIHARVKNSELSIDESMNMIAFIQEKSQGINQLIEDMSRASEEQILGVEDVNRAMGQLNLISGENKGDSEEIAHSASIVLERTNVVNDVSNRIKILLYGS